MNTYKAMQITAPGKLELVEREIPQPGTGEVLIKVDACGICGADAGAIDGNEKGLEFPRVPGHEVVGRILAIGDSIYGPWKIGQRVGIGRLGGHCNHCDQCRRGQFVLCESQPITGSSVDGGYAEMMLAKATGLVAIPDELKSVEAAPLLCAGIATFNALKKSGAEAGDLVAILGIGGLGHLAIQYARKMGFRTVAVGRGQDIQAESLRLGAHSYIDTNESDAALVLQEMGGAQVILTTITDGEQVSCLTPGLAPQGRLLILGAGPAPITVSPGRMVGNELSLQGSLTGTPFESEKTLRFSILADIRAQIETMPLIAAAEAYQKMKSGQAKFRMVLTMNH